MINQLLEEFKKNLDCFKNFIIKKKKFIHNFILSTFFILFILDMIGLISLNFEYFFILDVTDYQENIFYLLSNVGLLYILLLILNFKNSFFLLITSLPVFILTDYFNISFYHIYTFLLNFFYFNNFWSLNELNFFYDFFFTKLNYDYTVLIEKLNFRYLYHKFVNNYDLPLFFYTGLLFLITTISSLILLSYLGLYGVFFINLITIFFFWLSSAIYFNSFFIDNCNYSFNTGKWFIISFNKIVYFDFLIDSISYSFMFLTLTIAVFVYIYAFSYFRYEPNVERFILFINCFVLSMILLVTSGNFFVLFLGWELIGLTSFFLINFWSTRISTLKSAFKAFVFNKFSDVSLLIGILIIYFCINDINILSFNNIIHNYNNYFINLNGFNIPIIEIISFFFIMCAFVKSAQFGFHLWLPDSMEAPVPASALIHSATLVSAGVFLLLRISPMFEYSIFSYYYIPLIGSFTAFFGGLCSMYQSDIKKILAYSTISHCGFLMICYNTNIVEYTVLYLYIHGFFKASVFLCVGNIIRFSRNYQDFRKMGGFFKYLPFECFCSFICLINLCGLPFSLGYYIKHLLLIGLHSNFLNIFIITNILGGAFFGIIYSYRLFYYTFFDFRKAKKIIYNQSNRQILKSYYYTNTTLASNISILLLIIISYVISILMFNIFLNSSSMGESLEIHSINTTQQEEFNNPLLNSINNISFFNWIIIISIISIILFSWRICNNYYKIINLFFFLIVFTIFILIFYLILLY